MSITFGAFAWLHAVRVSLSFYLFCSFFGASWKLSPESENCYPLDRLVLCTH